MEEQCYEAIDGGERTGYGDAGSHSSSNSSARQHHMLLSKRYVGKVVAEVLGTFWLMVAVGGSIAAGWDVEAQAATIAMALLAIISSLAHISGAHLNPAITIALATSNQFPWSHVPGYFIAQLFGGIFAMFFSMVVYDIGDFTPILTKPSNDDGWTQAFTMEVALTFALCFLATSMNTLSNFGKFESGIIIGCVVATNMLLGCNISGASMNPIRSLAPAILQNNYETIWIYIVAPMIGAIGGAFSFKWINATTQLNGSKS